MYLALTNDISQQTLTQVAVWTIGEFGDILINPVSEKEVTGFFITKFNIYLFF